MTTRKKNKKQTTQWPQEKELKDKQHNGHKKKELKDKQHNDKKKKN
jgi:hypothetical protein